MDIFVDEIEYFRQKKCYNPLLLTYELYNQLQNCLQKLQAKCTYMRIFWLLLSYNIFILRFTFQIPLEYRPYHKTMDFISFIIFFLFFQLSTFYISILTIIETKIEVLVTVVFCVSLLFYFYIVFIHK